jgi:hypothetical protein
MGMMRKWNCEVIPDYQLSDPVVAFCKRINGTAIRIPVRLRGLTSSGKRGGCYYNVNIATKLFGGKSLVGWLIKPRDPSLPPPVTTELFGHAVWLNSQNRASCITGKSWGSDLIPDKDGKKSIDMIIWKESPTSSPYFVYDLYCDREEISWLSENKWRNISQDRLNAKKCENLFACKSGNLYELIFETRTIASNTKESALRKIIQDYEKAGGFSERSLATGKSYDDIKNDRLGRLK